MEDLYSFLKKKLKENKMKIGTFIELTNMSKSTIYRVMKGYQKPSYELLEMMYNILNLSSEDKRKLNYYISTVDMDQGSIEASNTVKHLLFENKNTYAKDIELVYYNNDEKYIKSLHEILDGFENSIVGKNAKLNAYIVNSTDESIMNNVEKYTRRFSKISDDIKIEHLVGFSNYNAVRSVKIVESFIPMLKYSSYNLFYTNTVTNEKTHLFSNYIMITCSYIEDDYEVFSYYIISFMNDSISTCYSGKKKDSVYDMFVRNFNYIKESYIPSITSNVEDFDFEKVMKDIDFLESQESCSEVYLFKRSPCYKRIPPHVFKNIGDRIIKSGQVTNFVKAINKKEYIGEQESCSMLNGIVDEMSNRYIKAKNIFAVDILSKNGLNNFVETGILSDHFKGMPTFLPEDIVDILEDMKRRHLDSNEKYKMYIIGDTSESNFILTIFKDKGFLIENVDENNLTDTLSYCLIEEESICNILYEFAKEYVPSRLAMIENDAMEYIDSLIEKAKEKIK